MYGIDHLYEAHKGSKENPVVVEAIGVHGNDVFTGCLGMKIVVAICKKISVDFSGGCHKDAADAVAYYTIVPPNTLAVCIDCGIHFVARINEQLTFWPDGVFPFTQSVGP